jgi:hypothetical protein
MNRRLAILVAALVALAVIAAAVVLAVVLIGGGDDDEAKDVNIVEGYRVLNLTEIHETEYALRPKTITFERHAYYGLKVINDGEETHAFRIKGPGLERETEDIEPGGSTELAVFLRRSGTYVLSCPIDGHETKGMKATLIVR